ncbi:MULTISPECIES: penicillin-binding protein [Priestia]|uniref:penicillin-binding protein n=1 Tax=Priestia TaxID=2800373 RepID=UPI000BF26A5E|nr:MULTISPECIES: penicillin-binding protein [Priestia]MBK0008137.1 penicillin-binding protein [Bacillus sp. S35]MCM3251121.1 penicillin-binding protein [Priestia aryabhattai]MCM3642901.1 penicillin-binding protein [Priestia aryabhattai]PFW72782.1 penicillin-binding protein [Priestia aryabhattai]
MTTPRKNSNISTGAAILILIFALLFFVLAIRFFYIQATGKADGEALAEIAQKQHTRTSKIEGQRGTIYDRNGEAIAQDTGAYTVVAILDKKQTKDKDHPQHVVDPEKTAGKLAPLLNMDESKIESMLTRGIKRGTFQVELGPGGRDIDNVLKQKIEKLNLPGITFLRDSKRFYPNGVFASSILGYAQKDDTGKIVGKMGIEKVFDKQLSEEDGYVKYEAAKNGIKLPDPKESIVAPKNGDSVTLTIDEKIQTFLEDAMTAAAKEYKPEELMATVVNPKTGEILAMSNRPSFDPNIRDITSYRNPFVENSYELGSTMKIFTLAAAIDAGVYNGEDRYQSGSYKVTKNSVPINDHNGGVGWGAITFNEGIQRSSNVAVAILANEKLGTDRLYKYLDKFGFMDKTGIDLPNEASSKLVTKYPRDRVTTAFGQASAFTPIQEIQAATAIANDGKMMKPYVIKQVVDETNKKTIKKTKPTVVGQPISKKAANETLGILETVVSSDDGTGKPYAIEGYDVAGKTGTAQIPGPTGGYLHGHGKNFISFMGFAPAKDPKLLVYVAVKNPTLTPQETGTAPLTAVFNPVMKNSLQYLGVEPQKTDEDGKETKEKKVDSEITLKSYVNESVDSAVKDLKQKGLVPVVIGKGGTVESQSPTSDTIVTGQRVFIKTNGKATMPDLTGFSHRDVIRFSEFVNVRPSALENGYVVSQSIKAGDPLKAGTYLKVELETPKEFSSTLNKLKETEKSESDSKKDDKQLD